MFVSVLRGHLAHEHWTKLQQHYEKLVQSLPEGLLDTYLIQGSEQPTLWEILTIWQSEEAFEKGRAQKKTEACELLFCDAGEVPERQEFRVRKGHWRV